MIAASLLGETGLLLYFVVCWSPWLAVLTLRLGAVMGLLATGAAAAVTLLAVLVVTPLTPVPAIVVIAVASAIVAAAGVVAVRRTPGALRRPARPTIVRWVASSVGGVAWIGTMLLSQVIEGGSRLNWAMNGDSANNIYLAHQVLHNNGIVLGALSNPVPVPAALLALLMSPGEALVAHTDLLEGDVTALVGAWVLVLAMTCLLAGLVASAFVSPRHPWRAGLAGATGSALPLTWLVAGLPIEYGYFNAHVALPLLLSAWLIFLASRRAVVPAIVALSGVTILMLATWTPLGVFPAVLALVCVVRAHAQVRSSNRRSTLWLLGAFLGVITWVSAQTIPTVMAQADAFSTPSHGLPVLWLVLALLVAFTSGCALVLRSRVDAPAFAGWVAVVAAMLAVSAAVVYSSRNAADPFASYYSSKAAWFLTVFAIMLAVSYAAGAVDSLAGSHRLGNVALATVAAVALVATTVTAVPSHMQHAAQPLDRVLTGRTWLMGNAATERIFVLADPARPGILWRSGDPDEALINFWVVSTGRGHIGGDETLRAFSFVGYREYRATGAYDDSDPADLCAILPSLTDTIEIHTTDAGLADSVARVCGPSTVHIVVDAAP